jgi:2-(1,2-epoxy-1,2-dihydrophenyl)acetyl-CoA isomerase
MVEVVQNAFRQASQDTQVRCVLITGNGNTFSAGHDIGEILKAEGQSFRVHLQQTYNPLILQIRRLEKPVIAAINGTAAGAGLGIALACDLRIAAVDANFVVGFMGIGLAPDSGVALFLPVLIGLGRAIQFTFTNEPINAGQALAWGMINRIVPAENLVTISMAYARQLAQGPVHAMGLAKRDYNKSMLGNLEEVLDYEAHLQEIAGRGEEHREGVRAFIEKRPPIFI